MKHLAILLTLSILTSTRIRAQEMETDYKAWSGQMVEDVLPIDIQYLLPVFEKAAVTLQSGEEQTGRINIHTPTQKVHMLDEKGDTMMVAGQEDIVRIQTRDCTIIPADTCWVTVITEHGGITLSSLASIELEYPDGTFTLRCIYKTEFVLTSEGRMYPCRLQSFLKLFPEKKKQIRGFAKTNYTYFNELESVMQLFNFCAGI